MPKIVNKTDWLDLWMTKNESILEDLCFTDPLQFVKHRKHIEKQMEKFKSMSHAQIQNWCYDDLLNL